jgi:hypothetical protein
MNKLECHGVHLSARLGRVLHRGALALALCVLAAGAAHARAPTKGITGGLESGTDLVRLPGTPGGTLTAIECRGCPSLRLSFDRNTRYYIGKEPVTYARFRDAASKGNFGLYISYRLDTKVLTRLRLPAAVNE